MQREFTGILCIIARSGLHSVRILVPPVSWRRISPMINKELLEILVCPACRAALEQKDETLRCTQCRRIYPIRDGIPILLVDEARIDPA